MQLINRDTDYAIRALDYIACRKNGAASVSEISKRLRIPYPFLRKILQRLHKEGMLKSYEGRAGGFVLRVPIDKILLLDLIKIFQGPVRLADCLFNRKTCPDTKYCILKKKIERIEHLVSAELETVTVASLHHGSRRLRKQ